jgi:hypothetical protein
MTTQISRGTKVRIKPTDASSADFKEKINKLAPFTAYVGGKSHKGICTLILPAGLVIEGYSQAIDDIQHCMQIHESELEAV